MGAFRVLPRSAGEVLAIRKNIGQYIEFTGLLQQEHADRTMRSVNHQMNMAKRPMHRDLAGFDFSASSAHQRLVNERSNFNRQGESVFNQRQ